MTTQPVHEALHHGEGGIGKRQFCQSRFGKRRGDRRADTSGTGHDRSLALDLPPSAQHPADETFPVEHVADKAAVRSDFHCVAGSSNLRIGGNFVQQSHGGDLVRHGDQRAMDIGKAEDQFQKCLVVIRPASHRHHDCINAVFLEIGIVDQRRLEGMRRETEMCDEFCVAAYHRPYLPAISLYRINAARGFRQGTSGCVHVSDWRRIRPEAPPRRSRRLP
ncbi:hypothetical protein D3C80_730720 [compost metagenome]